MTRSFRTPKTSINDTRALENLLCKIQNPDAAFAYAAMDLLLAAPKRGIVSTSLIR